MEYIKFQNMLQFGISRKESSYDKMEKMRKEEILKQLKDRKSSLEKLLTKNSNNVIDVDLEIGIRINELDEVIKLFE